MWNASRFILMNISDKEIVRSQNFKQRPGDLWIMSKCNRLVLDVTENMDKFELGIALQKVYDFIWDEFCDWYIELAKFRIYHAEEDEESANDAMWTLREVLKKALKLLHPFMPFVSEEIYSSLVPVSYTHLPATSRPPAARSNQTEPYPDASIIYELCR